MTKPSQIRFRSAAQGRLLVATLLLTAGFANALAPLTPPGGQRGTSVEVTLNDDNIAAFQELITYQPGLSLTDLTVDEKEKKRATATLHIAPDAALGEHSLRIRTAHDISYLRSFWVGPFPSVSQTEPDNSSGEAQRIELNTTVHGVIEPEDVDGYIVSLKKGQRLSVEAEAMRLGHTLFDAHLTIFGPDNLELADCDDTPFLKTDPFISLIAPQDGDYRIAIREAAYEGSNQSHYRLHIGTNPRPSAIFPLGGKPGETVNFTFLGDPTGTFTQSITLPSVPRPDLPVFPVQNGETAPSPHFLIVSPLEHSPQSNENFTRGKAHPFLPVPSAVNGIIDGTETSRWFKFSAKKDQNLDIRVLARAHRSPIDAEISLHDAEGKCLAENDDDQQKPDSLIKWTAPSDGGYLLRIADQLNRTGPDFIFRIEINERQPLIAATLPLAERNNSQKNKFITIPRGSRYATVIQVRRENIGCDITFDTVNLPPGIRMITPPVPKSLNSFPVIFEALTTAPLGSALQTFTIRSTGEGVPAVSGPLSDTVNHIEINNEGTYHSHTSERVPIAVIESVPFAIELEQPEAPIVKNGQLMLKMRVTRSGKFEDKIVTKFLWSPSGISAPVSVDIPPGKTEAEFELNANNDAAVGTWHVCVIAEADTPSGRRTVSSSFVPLIIAEPYLNFRLDLAVAQLGKTSTLVAKIEQLREFSGTATAELLSLPHGVTSKPVNFTKDQKEILFPLEISTEAKPGKASGLFCKVLVPENGRNITHQTGQGGTLRIDPAAKTEEPKPAGQPKDEVANAGAAPAKPLSRLEQLRQNK